MPSSPEIGARSALRWLPLVFGAAGALGLGGWLQLAWQQIFHPLELFGHEGAIVDHIARVLRGEPIYGPPAIDFVPFLYTPAYYWVCAAFAWAGDLAFVVPRLVSFGATLGSLACLLAMVVRAGGASVWGMVAIGAYALAASRVEAWYALAQVDSLFVLCLSIAMLLAQRAESLRAYFLVGLVFAAAFWCKQSGLVAGLVFAAAIAPNTGRGAAGVVAGMAIGIAPAVVWFVLATDGWFWFYVFAIPAGFGEDIAKFGLLLRHDVPVLLPAGVIAIACLVNLWQQGQRQAVWRYGAIGLSLAGTAIAGRLHVGGHVNTLLPALWLMALALGLGGGLLWRAANVTFLPARWTLPAVAALTALQLALISGDFDRFRPAPNGKAVAAAMKEKLALAERPMLLAGLGYLVGEPSGADSVALNDVMRIDPERARPVLAELERAMRDRRYRTVVIEDFLRRRYEPRFEAFYRSAGPLAEDYDALRPRAGLDFGPPWLLVPR